MTSRVRASISGRGKLLGRSRSPAQGKEDLGCILAGSGRPEEFLERSCIRWRRELVHFFRLLAELPPLGSFVNSSRGHVQSSGATQRAVGMRGVVSHAESISPSPRRPTQLLR